METGTVYKTLSGPASVGRKSGVFLKGTEDLFELLRPAAAEKKALGRAVSRYPFLVSKYYASLAVTPDASDAVAVQFLPDVRELESFRGGAEDPFSEHERMRVPGLIHRYRDRVVLLASAECAVRCRHCTRKNVLDKMGIEPSRAWFARILEYLEGADAVREVIVSGGDPLLLDTALLDWLLDSLRKLPRLEALRIGTRLPVVLPERVTPELCDVMRRHRPLWVATQYNCAAEITAESIGACDRILTRGIPIVNQAVLLKGVNDTFERMRDLCNGLQRNMIKPYYVLQCDPVLGTRHLAVSLDEARRLSEQLRRSVGGLSMPVFAADVPGAGSKIPLEAAGPESP
ncbi:MAG: KamA family radical SAM protein [Kiritimatiellia bacterium]